MKSIKVLFVVLLLLLCTGKVVYDTAVVSVSKSLVENLAGEPGEGKETEPKLAELFLGIAMFLGLIPIFMVIGEKQVPLKDHFRLSFYPPIHTPPPNGALLTIRTSN